MRTGSRTSGAAPGSVSWRPAPARPTDKTPQPLRRGSPRLCPSCLWPWSPDTTPARQARARGRVSPRRCSSGPPPLASPARSGRRPGCRGRGTPARRRCASTWGRSPTAAPEQRPALERLPGPLPHGLPPRRGGAAGRRAPPGQQTPVPGRRQRLVTQRLPAGLPVHRGGLLGQRLSRQASDRAGVRVSVTVCALLPELGDSCWAWAVQPP